MLNSILLFLSSYNFTKKYKFVFIIALIINFIVVNNKFFANYFTYINLLITLFIILICSFRKTNKYLSAVSMLLYSIFIDIYCFFFFPLFDINISLFEYIFNGILFNAKFIITPVFLTILIESYKQFKRHKTYYCLSKINK